MRKFFARDKPKPKHILPTQDTLEEHAALGLVQGHQPGLLLSSEDFHARRRSSDEIDRERWEVISAHERSASEQTQTQLQALVQQQQQQPQPQSQLQPQPDINEPVFSPPPPLNTSRSSSLASLPPGASPPVPNASYNATSSPSQAPPPHHHTNPSFNANNTPPQQPPQMLRKKTPGTGSGTVAALGILKALDPHPDSEDNSSQSDGVKEDRERKDEKKEKKAMGFWERAGVAAAAAKERSKEKEREKERTKEREREKREERSGEDGQELTRMIGWLTATASEDWSLVLEVCERASASEANAKEAIKALRREFKYAEAPAQLSAARLWAIMLRNSSDTFISQSTSRKFLDTLEDVITSPRTSPVVRERLLDVLAAAAWASHSKAEGKHDQGFRTLWKKVKPADRPDEGMPFDTEDAMFNPSVPRRASQYSISISNVPQHSPPLTQSQPHTPPTSHSPVPGARKYKSSNSRNKVIPVEEDMRRLFQECKVGKGNAALLSEALAFASPEDLHEKDIIREFHHKCLASQELIYAQIPWASAGAERSRAANSRGSQNDVSDTHNTSHSHGEDSPQAATTEEQLLAALLEANEDLLEALRLYDDLERVGIERQAEERSRRETRMDRSRLQYTDNGRLDLPPSLVAGGSRSHSPSPSPSPASSAAGGYVSPPQSNLFDEQFSFSPTPPNNHSQSALLQSLAPPPPAPHGPRSPAQNSGQGRSRTPSPERPNAIHPNRQSLSSLRGTGKQFDTNTNVLDDEAPLTPIKPSAKALGKRKVVDVGEPDKPFDPNDLFYEQTVDKSHSEESPDSDSDHGQLRPWYHPIHYVYDAAAERTEQRIREGQLALVNGVR